MLADFESYAVQGMKDWQVPGMAIAIMRGDQIIYVKAFGVKEVGRPDPVDVNTVFQIGSTSKAFTAALVSMMVDDGRFGWQDGVVGLLPEFMMYDPWVTRQFEVVDLMAQRSGLPGYAGDDQSALGFDRDHIIHSLRYLQPVTSFRSEFAYQNGLFLVAAGLVEKSTGERWETNLQQRIFSPLGMSSSSATLDAFRRAPDRIMLHHKVDGKVVPIPLDQRAINWNYIYAPAGGINSTVMDMARWLQLQLGDGVYKGKRLISSKNVQYMHEPKIYMNPEAGSYCLAWVKTPYQPYPLIWHNGETSGVKTLVQIIPEAKLGIVVLTNLRGTFLPEALGRRFADLYFGNPFRDWSKETLAKAADEEKTAAAQFVPPASPDSPLPLDRYAGTYTNPVFGDAVVTVQDGALVMVVGPGALRLILRPWNRDTFVVNEKDIELTSLVSFTIGADRNASSFTASEFDKAKEGTFTRTARMTAVH